MSWITEADVVPHLGLAAPAASDATLIGCTAAALTYCQRQRPDLDPAVDPGASVRLACVMYAGYLYRRKSSPSGLPGVDALGQYDGADAMTEVYRLLGNRKPRIR